ncbi:hypothetical protein EDB86DRAFT_2904448 [Lactarius hatsudake]|nr:hypothetical protein EDB86DRAFT_2904448 [Lactarius hatsudake]
MPKGAWSVSKLIFSMNVSTILTSAWGCGDMISSFDHDDGDVVKNYMEALVHKSRGHAMHDEENPDTQAVDLAQEFLYTALAKYKKILVGLVCLFHG